MTDREQQEVITVTAVDGSEVQIPLSEANQKVANKGVRDYADSVKARSQELQTGLLASHLGAIGLTPDEGLGKAIAKEYDGAISLEAVTEYAVNEYSHTPPEVQPDSEPGQPAPELEEIVEGQQRQAQVESVSAPVQPVTDADMLVQHEQKMTDPEATVQDAQASVAAKLAGFDRSIGR